MDTILLTSEVMSKLYEFVVACEECKCILYIPELEFYRNWLKSYFGVNLEANQDRDNTEKENSVALETISDHQDVKMLQNFIELIEKEPFILNIYDLYFYKQWIVKNGGKFPAPLIYDNDEMIIDYDIFNFIFDYDFDEMSEISAENLESSNKKRDEAVSYEASGELEKALELYTEALKLNPSSSNLYTKRAKVYLTMKRPVKAINDATKSIYLNENFSTAYNIRGKAYLMLAIYECAYTDLTKSCQIDFDEETFLTYKRIEPMAKKLTEYRRSIERSVQELEYASALEYINLSKNLLKTKIVEENKDQGDSQPTKDEKNVASDAQGSNEMKV